MKKIFFTLIVALIISSTINLCAQSRESVKANFILKSQKLTKATGWECHTTTGQWIENKNVISDRKTSGRQRISFKYQNFKWIQFATINHEGELYYVLLYERLGGRYKYPHIKQNWERDLRTYYFVITPKQFEEIKKQIEFKSGENIGIESFAFGYLSDRYKHRGGAYSYNEENLLAEIITSLKGVRGIHSCFTFNSQILDGGNIVRFRLPDVCDRRSGLSYFIDKGYFEVKYTEFISLLNF